MRERNVEKDLALLERLCSLFGPSGCEGEVADEIERLARPLCDSLCRDRMGNVLCLIKTGDPSADGRRRVMLSAHMDEVGLMITEICDDGLLRFDTVGGINEAVLEGRKVILGDEVNRVRGVIASKAIHHKKKAERDQVIPISKMYIDIGAAGGEEAKKWLEVGSFGVFDSEFYRFGAQGAYVKGRALDDRMGCAALLRTMEALKADPPKGDLDLYFCFTTREEIGGGGARVAAAKIRPHLSIVLESTAVGDLPDTEAARRVAFLGKGVALSLMDRMTIYDRPMLDFGQQIAAREGIPTQIKQYVSGGNDSGVIHQSGTGVRPMTLSVPTRYLHSASCVVCLEDYFSLGDLCEAMLRHMDTERP